MPCNKLYIYVYKNRTARYVSGVGTTVIDLIEIKFKNDSERSLVY